MKNTISILMAIVTSTLLLSIATVFINGVSRWHAEPIRCLFISELQSSAGFVTAFILVPYLIIRLFSGRAFFRKHVFSVAVVMAILMFVLTGILLLIYSHDIFKAFINSGVMMFAVITFLFVIIEDGFYILLAGKNKQLNDVRAR